MGDGSILQEFQQFTPHRTLRWRFWRYSSTLIVPREYNFVLLPEATGFAARIEWIESLNFDRRLFSVLPV